MYHGKMLGSYFSSSFGGLLQSIQIIFDCWYLRWCLWYWSDIGKKTMWFHFRTVGFEDCRMLGSPFCLDHSTNILGAFHGTPAGCFSLKKWWSLGVPQKNHRNHPKKGTRWIIGGYRYWATVPPLAPCWQPADPFRSCSLSSCPSDVHSKSVHGWWFQPIPINIHQFG